MIEYWRSTWYERTNSTTDPNFPFGFVQVSLFYLIVIFFFSSSSSSSRSYRLERAIEM